MKQRKKTYTYYAEFPESIHCDEGFCGALRLTREEAERVESLLREAGEMEIIPSFIFRPVEKPISLDEFKEYLPVCYVCGEEAHTCAGCGESYCDCTIAEWAVGSDGVTYCSAWCAGRS